jgi:hypothetical protein
VRPDRIIRSILAKLSQESAVMIDRPSPPAAPRSGHQRDRPCHSKVAGLDLCLQKLERAVTTIDVHKLCPSIKVLATKDP